MEVHTEREGGALIARAVGRIDGVNAREFESALHAALGEHDSALILDLQSLSYISSAGLRVILMAAKMLQRRGGKFVICSLSGSIDEVFEISGFNRIIPTHATRSEALASLG
jgi:anti-sigma B factor antagonist